MVALFDIYQFSLCQVIKTNKQTNKTKNKQTKQKTNKQNENQTNKQTQNKGPFPRPFHWLAVDCTIFHTNDPAKWLQLKWQVAQSFHQARSHDLF